MEKKMIINAINSQECRIAITDDGVLSELEVDIHGGKKLKGNIYKAKITRIEPSLQAAFIDIGASRNGFLQINDVHPAFYQGTPRYSRSNPNRVSIQDVLYPGQDIIVQVVKEERELKGATLTTYLSLPGRYIVLMPGSDSGGVSRKINDSEQRRRLKNLSQELEIPTGMGMIIRTAGLDRSQTELARDLSLQLKLWEKILSLSQSASSPSVLYKENDVVTRVVRDYFTPDIRQIIIDEEETFKKVREFVDEVMPRYRSRIQLYSEKQPIFSFFGIEDQISTALKSEVELPSGGSIVIEPLEALVAIDVNSGKGTVGGSIEETALRTNLEAAEEISRQLKLRDLGGLIVIDFIDMMNSKNRATVEKAFSNAVKTDKARIELGKISKFGLFEMSRQRLRASLHSMTHKPCTSCKGFGIVKDPEVAALEALRKIQSAIIVGHIKLVKAKLSPSVALFLLNMKKKEIYELEKEYSANIYIMADGRLRTDEFEFEMDNSTHENGVPETNAGQIKSVASTSQDSNNSSSSATRNRKTNGSSDTGKNSGGRSGNGRPRRFKKFQRPRKSE